MTAHSIQGRTVTTPVEVRRARQWATQFVVPAARAQAAIEHTGLQVARPFPGRAIVTLVVVDYEDTDLDAYHEVGVGFLVRPHDAPPAEGEGALVREFWSGSMGAYIHQLPVDQAFTLDAGVSIWGFPKFLAGISLRQVGRYTVCELAHEGEHVFTLGVADRGWFPLPSRTPPSYSFHEGVLRKTEWQQAGARTTARLGGAELTLGSHPIAKELEALGLPKRALMTVATPAMQATFGDAEVVSPTG